MATRQSRPQQHRPPPNLTSMLYENITSFNFQFTVPWMRHFCLPSSHEICLLDPFFCANGTSCFCSLLQIQTIYIFFPIPVSLAPAVSLCLPLSLSQSLVGCSCCEWVMVLFFFNFVLMIFLSKFFRFLQFYTYETSCPSKSLFPPMIDESQRKNKKFFHETYFTQEHTQDALTLHRRWQGIYAKRSSFATEM